MSFTGLFAALGAGIAAAFGLIGLVLLVLQIIGEWRVFQKAGIFGLLALIPIVNFFCYCKIGKSLGAFFRSILYIILSCVFVGLANYLDIAIVSVIAYILMVVCLIAFLVVLIRINFRISYAFGHGFWFGVGLYFLPFIFLMILAFGPSTYRKD